MKKNDQHKTCKDLVHKKLEYRLADLKDAHHYFEIEFHSGRESHPKHKDLEIYDDYNDYVDQLGLCFDFVQAEPSEGRPCGYWRWQLSTGGPGDEFRIFTDYRKNIHEVQYVYLDWYDAATAKVKDIPGYLLQALEYFLECSSHPDEDYYG